MYFIQNNNVQAMGGFALQFIPLTYLFITYKWVIKTRMLSHFNFFLKLKYLKKKKNFRYINGWNPIITHCSGWIPFPGLAGRVGTYIVH
jgi:hypothetical protein